MILDDENILIENCEELSHNPFLILKQFLIENKTNRDFVYYDLKYGLELNLILNKIPIEKCGYNWRILADRINIEKCITLPSGVIGVSTIATFKLDDIDHLKICIETRYHKYDEIVKLLKQYIPRSYEIVYDENNIGIFLI